MNIKRIIFIGHQASLVGGAEDDLERILKYTSQTGAFYSTLLIPDGPRIKSYSKFVNKVINYRIGYLPGLKTSFFDYLKYILKFFIQAYEILKKVKVNEYNICVVNVTVLIFPAIFLKFLNRKIKIVFWVREMIKPDFIRNIVFWLISKISSGVIFVSNGLKEEYIKCVGENKNLVVLYSACEPIEFFKNERTLEKAKQFFDRICPTTNAKFILNIGPVSPIKNQKLIIESLEKIKSSNPDFFPVFLHLGKMDPHFFYAIETLKLIKDKGLEKNCYFLGVLDKETTQAYIKLSNVIVISSISEGFPLVVSEAFMNNTALITTNCISNEKILKDNYNCIIIKKDSTELAAAINKTLQNNEFRTSLIQNAETTNKKYLNLDNNMSHFINFLHSI